MLFRPSSGQSTSSPFLLGLCSSWTGHKKFRTFDMCKLHHHHFLQQIVKAVPLWLFWQWWKPCLGHRWNRSMTVQSSFWQMEVSFEESTRPIICFWMFHAQRCTSPHNYNYPIGIMDVLRFETTNYLQAKLRYHVCSLVCRVFGFFLWWLETKGCHPLSWQQELFCAPKYAVNWVWKKLQQN